MLKRVKSSIVHKNKHGHHGHGQQHGHHNGQHGQQHPHGNGHGHHPHGNGVGGGGGGANGEVEVEFRTSQPQSAPLTPRGPSATAAAAAAMSPGGCSVASSIGADTASTGTSTTAAASASSQCQQFSAASAVAMAAVTPSAGPPVPVSSMPDHALTDHMMGQQKENNSNNNASADVMKLHMTPPGKANEMHRMIHSREWTLCLSRLKSILPPPSPIETEVPVNSPSLERLKTYQAQNTKRSNVTRRNLLGRDEQGRTPLHVVLQRRSTGSISSGGIALKRAPEEVVLSVLGGAPKAASIPDLENSYPLHVAVLNGHSVETVRRVLKCYPGAVVERNSGGDTPLLLAANFSIAVGNRRRQQQESSNPDQPAAAVDRKRAFASSSRWEIVRAFLRCHPESAETRNRFGMSALEMALQRHAPVDVVRALLRADPGAAAIRRRSAEGGVLTPLSLAVLREAGAEVVRLVAERCTDALGRRDDRGVGPISALWLGWYYKPNANQNQGGQNSQNPPASGKGPAGNNAATANPGSGRSLGGDSTGSGSDDNSDSGSADMVRIPSRSTILKTLHESSGTVVHDEFERFWEKMESLLVPSLHPDCVRSDPGGMEGKLVPPRGMEFLVVHAAAAQDCPIEVLNVAILLRPGQVRVPLPVEGGVDGNGVDWNGGGASGGNVDGRPAPLPLHLACSAPLYVRQSYERRPPVASSPRAAGSSSASTTVFPIERLLAEYPDAVRVLDRRGGTEARGGGRLPLHLALESGKAWCEGVGALARAEPRALRVRDRGCGTGTRRGLYPFMIAASSSHASDASNNDAADGNRGGPVVVGFDQHHNSSQRNLRRGHRRSRSSGRSYSPHCKAAARTRFGARAWQAMDEHAKEREFGAVHREMELARLDTVFELLRADPTVLSMCGCVDAASAGAAAQPAAAVVTNGEQSDVGASQQQTQAGQQAGQPTANVFVFSSFGDQQPQAGGGHPLLDRGGGGGGQDFNPFNIDLSQAMNGGGGGDGAAGIGHRRSSSAGTVSSKGRIGGGGGGGRPPSPMTALSGAGAGAGAVPGAGAGGLHRRSLTAEGNPFAQQATGGSVGDLISLEPVGTSQAGSGSGKPPSPAAPPPVGPTKPPTPTSSSSSLDAAAAAPRPQLQPTGRMQRPRLQKREASFSDLISNRQQQQPQPAAEAAPPMSPMAEAPAANDRDGDDGEDDPNNGSFTDLISGEMPAPPAVPPPPPPRPPVAAGGPASLGPQQQQQPMPSQQGRVLSPASRDMPPHHTEIQHKLQSTEAAKSQVEKATAAHAVPHTRTPVETNNDAAAASAVQKAKFSPTWFRRTLSRDGSGSGKKLVNGDGAAAMVQKRKVDGSHHGQQQQKQQKYHNPFFRRTTTGQQQRSASTPRPGRAPTSPREDAALHRAASKENVLHRSPAVVSAAASHEQRSVSSPRMRVGAASKPVFRIAPTSGPSNPQRNVSTPLRPRQDDACDEQLRRSPTPSSTNDPQLASTPRARRLAAREANLGRSPGGGMTVQQRSLSAPRARVVSPVQSYGHHRLEQASNHAPSLSGTSNSANGLASPKPLDTNSVAQSQTRMDTGTTPGRPVAIRRKSESNNPFDQIPPLPLTQGQSVSVAQTSNKTQQGIQQQPAVQMHHPSNNLVAPRQANSHFHKPPRSVDSSTQQAGQRSSTQATLPNGFFFHSNSRPQVQGQSNATATVHAHSQQAQGQPNSTAVVQTKAQQPPNQAKQPEGHTPEFTQQLGQVKPMSQAQPMQRQEQVVASTQAHASQLHGLQQVSPASHAQPPQTHVQGQICATTQSQPRQWQGSRQVAQAQGHDPKVEGKVERAPQQVHCHENISTSSHGHSQQPQGIGQVKATTQSTSQLPQNAAASSLGQSQVTQAKAKVATGTQSRANVSATESNPFDAFSDLLSFPVSIATPSSQQKKPLAKGGDGNKNVPPVISENPQLQKSTALNKEDKKAAPTQFRDGQEALYTDSRGNSSVVKILKVHLDDELDPFYTIVLPNGNEKQTDNAHLSSSLPPSDNAKQTGANAAAAMGVPSAMNSGPVQQNPFDLFPMPCTLLNQQPPQTNASTSPQTLQSGSVSHEHTPAPAQVRTTTLKSSPNAHGKQLRTQQNPMPPRTPSASTKRQLGQNPVGVDGDSQSPSRAKDDPSQLLCVSCGENKRQTLLLPCRHLCLCSECALFKNVAICPLCQTKVSDTVDVLL